MNWSVAPEPKYSDVFDESEHPRQPAGSPAGGQFAPKFGDYKPKPDTRHLPDQRAGMVVYRFHNGQLQFLLTRSNTPGFDEGYDLPKGQIERGESFHDAALREAHEETGLKIKERGELGKFPFQTRWGYPRDKTAHLWLGELASDNVDAAGNVIAQGDLKRDRENDVVRFFPAGEALRRVDADRRPMLRQAMQMLGVPEPEMPAALDTRLDDYTTYFDVDGDAIRLRPQVVNRAQGKLGEIMVFDSLKRQGFTVTRPAAANDFAPLDLIAERDGTTYLIEVKTASADKNDKRWRTNVGGARWQKILQDAGDLTPDERKGLFRKMTERIIEDKRKVQRALEARGVKTKPMTIGVTVDYRRREAALYYFDEWFTSKSWSGLRPNRSLRVSDQDLTDAVYEAGSVEINDRTGAFEEYPSMVTRKALSPSLAQALWDEFAQYADEGLAATQEIADMAIGRHAASNNVPNPEFDVTDPLYDDAVDDDETGFVGLEDEFAPAAKATNRRGVDALGAELESVIAQYRAGMIQRPTARQDFLDALRARYLKAFSKVRGAEKFDRANALVVQQAGYLDKFLDAVDAGLDEEKAYKRARLYAESLRAARAQAQTLKLPALTKLQWVVNPTAEHCTDCAGLAGRIKTAKRWRELGLFPGCAQNECGQFCKCKWRVVPGIPRKNSAEGKKIRAYLGI